MNCSSHRLNGAVGNGELCPWLLYLSIIMDSSIERRVERAIKLPAPVDSGNALATSLFIEEITAGGNIYTHEDWVGHLYA